MKLFDRQADITFNIFVFAGLMVLFVTLLTISYQEPKAAVMHPAKVMQKK